MAIEIPSPIIRKVSYSGDTFEELSQLDLSSDNKKLIFNYPTIYIVNDRSVRKNKYIVYVGETTDINRRTKQHMKDDIREYRKRSDWQQFSESETAEMFVIGHNYFNKSLTLDIENKLMHYLTSVESVQTVQNKRTNPQNDYYTSENMERIFSKIWRKLRTFNKELFPLESVIRDSALFKASPFHKLTDEQIKAKDSIFFKIISNISQNSDSQLILVEGEAGSGKTVLMSSLLYDLFNDCNFNASENKLKIHMLVNHNQQLTVYEQLVKKLGLVNFDHSDVVMKPTSYINRVQKSGDKADILIVDEAHLLLTRGKQSYRGKNHLKDLLANSRIVIAVYDPKQTLLTEQIWEEDELSILRHDAIQNNNYIHLENQMRINASEDTISWIRRFIDKGTIGTIPEDRKYDIKIFDDPKTMYKDIKEKSSNQNNGISRILATFDWEYRNTKPSESEFWNVTIGEFSLPWNLQLPKNRKEKHLSWAEQSQTINEIGSTFTIQGFDLNYAAVIIGPSVQYRNGEIVFCPENSKNKNAISNRTMSDGRKKNFGELLLKNELNVLLTRGVNGLYIYAVDPELQDALKNAQREN